MVTITSFRAKSDVELFTWNLPHYFLLVSFKFGGPNSTADSLSFQMQLKDDKEDFTAANTRESDPFYDFSCF